MDVDGTVFASLNLANSATQIDEIRVFNEITRGRSDYDVFFNNIGVVLEPSSALLSLLGISALVLRRRR